jgi:hypothetical protein
MIARTPLTHLFEIELAVRELGHALRTGSADQATALAALDTLLAHNGAA